MVTVVKVDLNYVLGQALRDRARICVLRLREQDADATPNMQLGRARGRRRNYPREHATANVFFTRVASALRAARARPVCREGSGRG